MHRPEGAPRPIPGYGTLFTEQFYIDIAHQMDPDQEISPEALRFFHDIAEDFFASILKETDSFVREKNKDEANGGDPSIQAEDVHFILRTKFNMSIPGGPPLTDTTVTRPTQEYQEKLLAVRQFSATHRDE